jgi:hypothetical protein
MRTDLNADDALHAGRALEETRDALISAAWPNFPFPEGESTVVFVLSEGLEFKHYFGKLIDGIFFHTSPPMVFLHGPPSRWELRRSLHQPTDSVLRHEMTHELAAKVFRTHPRWFSEGLAQFLEAVYYSEDGKSVVLGGVNPSAFATYRAFRHTTVRDTLAWSLGAASLEETEINGLYGTSWSLFHWLYNTQNDALNNYQVELARKGSAAAFEKAFPKFDADKANLELYEYMRHGKFTEVTMPLLSGKWSQKSFVARPLEPEEIGAVRATIEEAAKEYTKN